MNKVTLMGNLVRDPETRINPNGTLICNIGIAVNERYGDNEKVHFFDCVAFKKTGEIIAEHFHKGSRILIDGKLSQNRWETDDGQKRSKVEIIINSFDFVDRKSEPEPEAIDEGDVPF